MLHGQSNAKGIVIYDTALNDKNGVYGFYEDNDMHIIVDHYQNLLTLQKEHNLSLKKDEHKTDALLIIIFMMLLSLILYVCFFVGGLFPLLAVIFFAITAYFPIYIFCYSFINVYQSLELFQQYKRYHACEHMFINYLYHHDTWNLDDFMLSSRYEKECGTVYSATFLVFSILTSLLITLIPQLGFFRFCFYVLLLVCFLLVNLLFNSHHPLILAQSMVIQKPHQKDIDLISQIAQTFIELQKNK